MLKPAFADVLIVTVSGQAAEVQQALAPFGHASATGVDPSRIVESDTTQYWTHRYANAHETHYQPPNGALVSPDDPQLYREPTEAEREAIGAYHKTSCPIPHLFRDWRDGKGIRPKVLQVPNGWRRVRLPDSSLWTFKDWLTVHAPDFAFLPEGTKPDLDGAHRLGYVELNDIGQVSRIVKRFNPEARWYSVLPREHAPRCLLLRSGARASRTLWRDVDRESTERFMGMGKAWTFATLQFGTWRQQIPSSQQEGLLCVYGSDVWDLAYQTFLDGIEGSHHVTILQFAKV